MEVEVKGKRGRQKKNAGVRKNVYIVHSRSEIASRLLNLMVLFGNYQNDGN